MERRAHIIGLDKPVSNPLSQESDQARAIRKQAHDHEKARLESVAEMMALVALMVWKGFFHGREVVTVGKAEYQFGRGVKTDKTEAAHCLPGQAAFDSTPLHRAPDWSVEKVERAGFKPLALSSKLRNVAGRCDVVDVVVNDVDSLSEKCSGGRGLRPAYGRALQGLMETIIMKRPSDIPGVLKAALKGLDAYRVSAGHIYLERQEELRQRRRILATDGELEKHDLKWNVLQTYLGLVRDRSLETGALGGEGFRWIARDVLVSERDQPWA